MSRGDRLRLALATEPSKKSQIQADAARRIREALA